MPRVWQAAPHQFGQGKKHVIDEDRDELGREKTVCGRALVAVPGKEVANGEGDCLSCLNKIAMRPLREVQRQRWEEESRRYQEQREQELREQRARYHAYLKTPAWKAISRRVLERAHYLCEGCGTARATQAHHVTYEHVGNEFLWELRAVCDACHHRAHPDKEF